MCKLQQQLISENYSADVNLCQLVAVWILQSNSCREEGPAAIYKNGLSTNNNHHFKYYVKWKASFLLQIYFP